MVTTRADIDDFLQQHRIAMVGVSRDPKDFSRSLFREMRKRGYDMVPVNLFAEELEGEECFRSLDRISPKVDAVLLMTPFWEAEGVVRQCAELGITSVWMYRAGKKGAGTQKAIDYCKEHGIRVVEGCPLMFIRGTALIPHRAHGFILKLIGQYPAKAA
jgi:predicted CoA-binding protein